MYNKQINNIVKKLNEANTTFEAHEIKNEINALLPIVSPKDKEELLLLLDATNNLIDEIKGINFVNSCLASKYRAL